MQWLIDRYGAVVAVDLLQQAGHAECPLHRAFVEHAHRLAEPMHATCSKSNGEQRIDANGSETTGQVHSTSPVVSEPVRSNSSSSQPAPSKMQLVSYDVKAQGRQHILNQAKQLALQLMPVLEAHGKFHQARQCSTTKQSSQRQQQQQEQSHDDIQHDKDNGAQPQQHTLAAASKTQQQASQNGYQQHCMLSLQNGVVRLHSLNGVDRVGLVMSMLGLGSLEVALQALGCLQLDQTLQQGMPEVGNLAPLPCRCGVMTCQPACYGAGRWTDIIHT